MGFVSQTLDDCADRRDGEESEHDRSDDDRGKNRVAVLVAAVGAGENAQRPEQVHGGMSAGRRGNRSNGYR